MGDVPGYSIRAAIPADARAIALVQIAVRKTTYRGLVPDANLDRLDSGLEDRVRKWANRLVATDGWKTLAVDGPGLNVVGFCYLGPVPASDPAYTGIIDIIYVLKEHQRRGVGRWLFAEAARLLAGQGHRAIYLWVHARNAPARRFYEKIGGMPIAERRTEYDGVVKEEVSYGWDEPALRRLVRVPE